MPLRAFTRRHYNVLEAGGTIRWWLGGGWCKPRVPPKIAYIRFRIIRVLRINSVLYRMGRLTSPYDPSLIQMLYIWLTLSPYLAHPIYNTLYTSIWLTLYTIPYIHIWLTLYTTPYIRVSDSPYIQHPIYIFGSPYICECTRIWLTLYTTYLAHPIYNTLHTSVFTC